jgi:hypothetical protein
VKFKSTICTQEQQQQQQEQDQQQQQEQDQQKQQQEQDQQEQEQQEQQYHTWWRGGKSANWTLSTEARPSSRVHRTASLRT